MSVIKYQSRWNPAYWGVIAAIVLGLLLMRLSLIWVVVVVGGTAVLLLVLLNPLWGVGLALLLGPFGALEAVIFGNPILDSGQAALFVTVFAWVSRAAMKKRLFIRRTFLLPFIILFISVGAVSLLHTVSLTFGLRELFKWIEIALIMNIVLDLGIDARQKQNSPVNYFFQIGGLLILPGVVQAVIGIWQFGIRGDGPEHFIIFGDFYRAYGTFEQPNPFGGYMNLTGLLAVGTLLGLSVYFWQRWKNRAGVRAESRLPIWAAALVLFSAGLIVAALLFSWSRGAWLSFGAGTAVMVLFFPRKYRYGVLLFATAVIAFTLILQFDLLPASVTDRLVSFRQDLQFGDVRGADINDANYAVLERLAHWQAAINMANDHIWLGVGFGNYEPAYADYALINWPDPLGHAHNYYLNLLAEVGIVGLVAYLVMWTAVFYQTIRALQQENWILRGMVLGLLACWVGLAVHHLIDKLYVNNIYVHLGVMFGLLQLLDQQRTLGAQSNRIG